jgi:GntR family transcriptional regulator
MPAGGPVVYRGWGMHLKNSGNGSVQADGVPRYEHIVRTISHRIASGVYSPGEQIPSGSQLCAEFGVSQMTVRRALSTLEDRGLVYGVAGRGTFVKPAGLSDPDFRLDAVEGKRPNEPMEARLLSATMSRADARIAKMLQVEPGARVVHLRRLVSMAGTPALYHHEYILYDPRRTLVESQLQLTALEAVLDSDRGQQFFGGELTISAVLLDASAAEALGQKEGDLALSLEHVFRDGESRPVSYGEFLLRADQFRLRSRQGSTRRVIGMELLGDS